MKAAALPLCLVLSSALSAQPPGIDSVWVFPQPGGGWLSTMEVMPDGGYLFGGHLTGSIWGNWLLMRTTATGDTLWTRPSPRQFGSEPQAMAVLNDGLLVIGDIYIPRDSMSAGVRQEIWKLDLDGDTLWNGDFDEGGAAIKFSDCIAGDDGDLYLLGSGYVPADSLTTWQLRFLRAASDGEIIWSRHYAIRDLWRNGSVLRLSGGGFALAFADWAPEADVATLMLLDENGDSLQARRFPASDYWSLYPMQLDQYPAGVYNFIPIEYSNVPVHSQKFHWIRFTEDGEILSEVVTDTTSMALLPALPVEGGLLVAGTSSYLIGEDFDIVVARVAPTGEWIYQGRIEQPLNQSVRGARRLPNGAIALLGSSQQADGTTQPTVFFIPDDGPSGYLYSNPSRLDFGVVPLRTTTTRTVSLHLTGDTSITITEIEIPARFAVSLQAPATVTSDVPFEFQIAFRPDDREIYQDTVRLISTAVNSVLRIPVVGQAPFPVLTPQPIAIDFFWTPPGVAVHRTLSLQNTGTDTLFIEPVTISQPFTADTLGPLTILVGQSFPLNIEFRTLQTGEYLQTVWLSSNDPQSPDSVRLRGRCVGTTEAEEPPPLPTEFRLYPAFPNPFNSAATIRFDLPRAADVELLVYNLRGQRVTSLAHQTYSAGSHFVELSSATLASGLYFVSLQSPEFSGVQKLLVVK